MSALSQVTGEVIIIKSVTEYDQTLQHVEIV